jgi:hypothetical protein
MPETEAANETDGAVSSKENSAETNEVRSLWRLVFERWLQAAHAAGRERAPDHAGGATEDRLGNDE